MAGYIQPLLRAFGPPKQSAALAGEQSTIDRLSFELFGDLDRDGDGEAGVPRERHTPPGERTPQPSSQSRSATFPLPASGTVLAIAAYDASLRRVERSVADRAAPADVGDLVRGHAVYAQMVGTDGSKRKELAGLVVDYLS